MQVITDVLETISLKFDLWDEQYAQGLSPSPVIVSRIDTGRYADPL